MNPALITMILSNLFSQIAVPWLSSKLGLDSGTASTVVNSLITTGITAAATHLHLNSQAAPASK